MKKLIDVFWVAIANIPSVRRDAHWKSVHAADEAIRHEELAHGYYLRVCRSFEGKIRDGKVAPEYYLRVADYHRDLVFVFRKLTEDLDNPRTRVAALRQYRAVVSHF